MDTYGQIGPEKPGYDEDIAAVAALLRAGQPVAVALAHRMTRTEVVLTLTRDLAMIGGQIEGLGEEGDKDRIDRPWCMVAVREKGMCYVKAGIQGSYIEDKCRMNGVDADTIAAFVNAVLGGLDLPTLAPRRPAPVAS